MHELSYLEEIHIYFHFSKTQGINLDYEPVVPSNDANI